MRLLILLLIAGVAQGQQIAISRITETATKQFVSATDKTKWNAAVTLAAAATKDAAEASKDAAAASEMAAKQTTFIQGPGVTIRRVNDSTYMISSEYPPRYSTKARDSLDVAKSRAMLIYNLDKDALEVCNGVRWDQITTGIIVTQPPMTAPKKKK